MVKGRLVPELANKSSRKTAAHSFAELQCSHPAPKLIVVTGNGCLTRLSQHPLDQPGFLDWIRPDNRASNGQRVGRRRFAQEFRPAVKVGRYGHIGFKTDAAAGRKDSVGRDMN